MPVWLWALLPILLAAALVLPFLGREIFDVDEAATMIGACARHLGPCSPAEAIQASARWPGLSWGLAIAFSLWGQAVGWSEVAIRALPWLVGALTLAWLYRLGRDLFAPAIGLVAALLLGTSVLFLTYMHVARFYGPVILFSTITLWGYWQVALAARPPKRAAAVALLAGAVGLLYSHYFGALLVPAVGLFHLFLVRKDRRWRQAPALLLLALLLALPQAPDLLDGIAFNQGNEERYDKALHAPEVLSLLLRYLSSDLLHVPPPLESLLVPALLLLPLLVVRAPRRRPADAFWCLAGATTLLLLLITAVNEWIQVLAPRRVRYLASLWPPGLLLFTAAIRRPPGKTPRYLALAAVALIAISGALDFIQEGDLGRHSWAWKKHPVTLPVAQRVVAETCSDSLLLVGPDTFRYENRSYELYTGAWGFRRAPLYLYAPVMETLAMARERASVWLLYRTAFEKALQVRETVDRLRQAGWSPGLDWQDGEVTLRQMRSPLPPGEFDQNVIAFNGQVRSAGSWFALQDGRLRIGVDLQVAGHDLLSHHSLALHVIDPRTGQRVAQGDVGVGPGTCIPVRSSIDVSALPAGDYEVHAALYDRRTGERLTVRDTGTGEVSGMHVLQRFRIG